MLVNASISRWRSVRHRLAGERVVAAPPETAQAPPGARDDEM
jgi:hypothetical protein